MTVWHAGFACFAAGVLLLNEAQRSLDTSIRVLEEAKARGKTAAENERELVLQLRRESWGVFKLALQVILATAAITGVTMSILFREGYEDPERVATAIKMAFGFFICAGAAYVWVFYPCLGSLERSQRLFVWSHVDPLIHRPAT